MCCGAAREGAGPRRRTSSDLPYDRPPRVRPTSRTELQKQAQVEYLQSFYEVRSDWPAAVRATSIAWRAMQGGRCFATSPPPPCWTHRRPSQNAERVQDSTYIYTLDSASPRAKALAEEEAQAAALNKRLHGDIRALASWPDLQALLEEHGPQLNYLNVSELSRRAGQLALQVRGGTGRRRALRSSGHQPASWGGGCCAHPTPAHPPQRLLAARTQAPCKVPEAVAVRLAQMALDKGSWYQPMHFAGGARRGSQRPP